MIVRVLLAVLAVSSAEAQELAFSPDATLACLDAAGTDDTDAREDCIGLSAAACASTPDGATTVGTRFCYSREADWWDQRLNDAYLALRRAETAMRSEMEEIGATVPDAPLALREMQRAWIGYRDAACAYEHTTWGGGTGGGPAHAACMMALTGRQALELERRLTERQR